MTSIHSLFDWLLEPIFQQLSRKERLICKMVCQRWYRILMESRKFRDDRHIYLQKCVINVNQVPASVFMNAVFPYEILTVGSSITFQSHQDLNQFAEHIGSSITEVEIFNHHYSNLHRFGGSATEMVFDGSSKEKSVFQILNQMPLLKSLTIHNYLLEDIETNLTFIREGESGLLNLDVLNIQTYCRATEELKQNLKKIKLFIKNNVKIIIDMVALHENSSIENMLSFIEATKINQLIIYTAGKSNEEMEKLLKADLSCESVRFICPPTESPYPYLEKFSNVHPNVKEFILQCYFLPPKIELPRLTELSLSLGMPVQSLKSLETLTNLKFLRIVYVYNDDDINRCRFGHDAVNLPNLKQLHLYRFYAMRSCPECIEALFHSFKLFSNLRSVTFSANNTLNLVPSFQSMVLSVFVALKQLTHLSFVCYGESNMDPSEIPSIVEDLARCGYPVQDLPTLMTSVEQLNNRGYKMLRFKLNINHDDNTSTIELTIRAN